MLELFTGSTCTKCAVHYYRCNGEQIVLKTYQGINKIESLQE
ncbi:MAG TPA: hypothetical protein VKM55_24405 [Candidatus Lokiarchaeia archaeon]|nr:hypothetical protein [Candidatus Lokiarchaeia archaeon]